MGPFPDEEAGANTRLSPTEESTAPPARLTRERRRRSVWARKLMVTGPRVLVTATQGGSSHHEKSDARAALSVHDPRGVRRVGSGYHTSAAPHLPDAARRRDRPGQKRGSRQHLGPGN